MQALTLGEIVSAHFTGNKAPLCVFAGAETDATCQAAGWLYEFGRDQGDPCTAGATANCRAVGGRIPDAKNIVVNECLACPGVTRGITEMDDQG